MQPIDISKKYKMRKGTKILELKRLNDSCLIACYEEPGYSAGLYYTNFGTVVVHSSDGLDSSPYDLILDEEEKPVEKLDINKKYKMRDGTKIDKLTINDDGTLLAFFEKTGQRWARPYTQCGIPLFKDTYDEETRRYELILDEGESIGTFEQPKRRTLQISAVSLESCYGVVALCDDGNIYEIDSLNKKWNKLPEIPQN